MSTTPRIIVADDDQALSRTLSWILKENGYEVSTVPNGENLIERLAAEQYDLLLLDIMMPKVDGLQLLERVKSDGRFKDLPVLMISSMPPEEATVRSLGLGAADFISKPFRVRELLARVKAHLRVGRELNQALAEAGDEFGTVVAAYENPMLRNLQIELRKYPEIAQALKSGELVLVQDVLT